MIMAPQTDLENFPDNSDFRNVNVRSAIDEFDIFGTESGGLKGELKLRFEDASFDAAKKEQSYFIAVYLWNMKCSPAIGNIFHSDFEHRFTCPT